MRRHHLEVRGRSASSAGARARTRTALVACVGALGAAYAGRASAQPLDSNPPLPDVLLLADTSGSMELMMDNCNTDTGLYPDGSGGGNCNGTIPCVALGSNCSSAQAYCDGVTARTPNRWGTEVAALTGDFVNPTAGGPAYSCLSMPRSGGSAFASEFSLQYAGSSKALPYDLNYYLNYHRPAEKISATTACVYGFVQGATGWYADGATSHQENPASSPPVPDFQAAQIQGYVYNTTTMTPTTTPATPCSGGFVQTQDGLINYGMGSIRFGLMTIDSDPLPNTGVTAVSDGTNLTFSDVANGGVTNNVTTGSWSYYDGWATASSPTWTGASVGRPAGCAETGIANIPYEVGARNPAAPPWEGRLMRFPVGAATSPASNNQNIMQAIRAMRPYGANPIAGMMDDAKYYYWTDPQGPAKTDPLASCRPNYIILLSHAAPNEDLEPYCQGGSGTSVGICPYDYPEYIAGGLASGTYSPGAGVVNAKSAAAAGPPVKTFVVGFSLSSNLGDAGTASCNDILTGTAPNQTVNTSSAFCGTPQTNGGDSGTNGNPLYAQCCALARIAINGGTQLPYFADNQTDLQKAFQAILAIIVTNSSTRATPVLLPQSTSSSAGGGPSAALFLSSFTPSVSTTWSGNVQRERYQCVSSSACTVSPCSQAQAITPANGDDFASNLQSTQGQLRNVIMVEPYPPSPATTPARNPSTNIRPWVNGASGATATSIAFDGYTMYDGVEYGFSYKTSGNSTVSSAFNTAITPDTFFPSGCTYKQPGSVTPFSSADCQTIALGFALGMQNPPSSWNAALSPYPTRYYSAGSVPATTGPFGGVLHSTPVIETPPSALLRDDSYQAFTQSYTAGYTTYQTNPEPRHSVLYVATIDGLLHAFGVDYNPSDPYTFIGSSHANEGGTTGLQNEMWTFIPPAVMPNLMSGVGGGETILLDGAPVVKDTIYQRTTVGLGTDWHTSLVAGFGAAMGGYYALDVTDPNFNNRGSSPNNYGPSHTSANSNTPPAAPLGYTDSSSHKPLGPHFLWQLTDTNLFAPTSGTPAITTLSVNDPDNSGKLTEIGVAILPGGAATPGSTTLGCPRVSYHPKIKDASPPSTSGYQLAAKVRQWTSAGCPSATNPARGRSLTIVRLDTGEVLRTFTVLNDLPAASSFPLYNVNSSGSLQQNAAGFNYQGRVTQAEFDSPISGTPVPYPSDVGAVAQRIFVGDQDGTIWRLDVSNPDPNQWFVEPFFDAYNTSVQGTASISNDDSWAVQRAPIVLSPTISVGRDGNVVLNFGTGDTGSIGTASNINYVYSVTELPNTSVKRLLANVNWYSQLPTAGEMVTGPSAVFDGGYYFATYAPSGSGATSCASGTAYLWGMDFTTAAGSNGLQPTTVPSPPSYGGVAKMLDSSGSLVQKLAQGSSIIPGITITSSSICSTTTTGVDPVTGGPLLSMSNVSPSSYQISALQGTPGASQGNNTAVAQVNVATAVHTATLVDSWASIVE